MNVYAGIVLAVACAVATDLAFFYKHRGAQVAPRIDLRHPLRSGRDLFAARWFAIGMAVAAVAWALHVAALALAPLSVVQVALASGVVLLGVFADRIFGLRVGRRQWVGLTLTAVGLVLLAVTAPGIHGANSSYQLVPMVAFETGLFGLGTLLSLGPGAGVAEEHHGVLLGAAAGILFGVADVAVKAVSGLAGQGHVAAACPWLLVAMAASVIAFYASARGLQQGAAVATIAVTATAANVAGVLGGIVVFEDPLPASTVGVVVQVVALVLVLAAGMLTASRGHGAIAPAAA